MKKKILQDLELITREYTKSQPGWPVHLVAQAGMVSRECGELMNKSLSRKYDTPLTDQGDAEIELYSIRFSALRTAAAAFRMIAAIDKQIQKSQNAGTSNILGDSETLAPGAAEAQGSKADDDQSGSAGSQLDQLQNSVPGESGEATGAPQQNQSSTKPVGSIPAII